GVWLTNVRQAGTSDIDDSKVALPQKNGTIVGVSLSDWSGRSANLNAEEALFGYFARSRARETVPGTRGCVARASKTLLRRTASTSGELTRVDSPRAAGSSELHDPAADVSCSRGNRATNSTGSKRPGERPYFESGFARYPTHPRASLGRVC